MNTESLLKLANAVSPEKVQETADLLEELISLGGFEYEDALKEINETLSVSMEKISSPGSLLSKIPSAVSGYGKTVGAGLVGSIAAAVATDLYDAAKRGMSKGNDFRTIMKANPELADQYDLKELKSKFDTLHKFAPEFAGDPNLGGDMLKQVMELPHNQMNYIKDLVATRKNLRDIKKGQFSSNTPAFIPHAESKAADREHKEKMMNKEKSK